MIGIYFIVIMQFHNKVGSRGSRTNETLSFSFDAHSLSVCESEIITTDLLHRLLTTQDCIQLLYDK